MSIEHRLQASHGSELDHLALWWISVRMAARPERHYAVMHGPECNVSACRCVPVIVRVPGGWQ